jgi:hypothetical protein
MCCVALRLHSLEIFLAPFYGKRFRGFRFYYLPVEKLAEADDFYAPCLTSTTTTTHLDRSSLQVSRTNWIGLMRNFL